MQIAIANAAAFKPAIVMYLLPRPCKALVPCARQQIIQQQHVTVRDNVFFTMRDKG